MASVTINKDDSKDIRKVFTRQTGILHPEIAAKTRVCIVGCGGIGSWTALFLAKLGIAGFELYDEDLVELHNLPNQLFRHKHLGKL